MSHLFYHDERFSLGRKDTLIDNEASSIHKKVGLLCKLFMPTLKDAHCRMSRYTCPMYEKNSIVLSYSITTYMQCHWSEKRKIALLAFIKYFMIFVEYCCVVFLSWKVKHCWNFVIVNLSLIFLIRRKFWIWYQTD